MSDVPNISIGGISGGQNNIGKTEIAGDQTQTNNYGDSLPPVDDVVAKVAESLPAEVAADWSEQIKPLMALPIAQQEEPETVSKLMAICEAIRPHAGVVWKNLAVFGATALETLATRNPIIAGIVQVCKSNQPQTPA